MINQMLTDLALYKGINIALNLGTAVVIIVLIVGSKSNKIKTQSINKSFIPLMLMTLGSVLSDLFGWYVNGNAELVVLNMVLNSAFYIFNYLTLAFSAKYLFDYLSYKSEPKREVTYLVYTASAAGILLVIINFFAPIIFEVDKVGVYGRVDGVFFGFSQLLGLLSTAVCAAVLIKYRRALSGAVGLFVMGYTVIPISALVIQAMFFGITLTNISFMLFGLLMFINSRYELADGIIKATNDENEKAANALQSQIVLKFLINAMVPIRELIEHNSDKAFDAINRMFEYKKHSQIDQGYYSLISLETEIRQARSFAELIKLYRGATFFITFDLQVTDVKIPTMTIIPLIENTAIYGAENRDICNITVKSFKENGKTVITVEDNGDGFDTEVLKTTKKSIFAISERLRLMCGGTLDVQSKVGFGTTVKIILPQ
jgi:signal transduction histidine kinase